MGTHWAVMHSLLCKAAAWLDFPSHSSGPGFCPASPIHKPLFQGQRSFLDF